MQEALIIEIPPIEVGSDIKLTIIKPCLEPAMSNIGCIVNPKLV